jgi:transposase
VFDVPARLSARVRALGGGSGRKTDDTDAFAVAVAGLRASQLTPVRLDDTVTVLRLLSDRRQELVEQRIATVNRLHRLLVELIPGGAGPALTAAKAKTVLASVRPRTLVEGPQGPRPRSPARPGRRGPAAGRDAQDTRRVADVADPGARHRPVLAARIIGEVGDVRRFPSRHHFASYTGTAPVDVSSGDNDRHRLNRGGNRRLHHALHIAAICQIRVPGDGQDYYRLKRQPARHP